MAADRSVLVRLRANVADFNRNVGTSTAAVSMLETRLQSADKTGGASIDRLSGRLRLLAEAAAVLGPALVPLGGVGLAGVAGLSQQLGFAAVAGGVLIASMQGLGDTLGAMHKAHLEPTVENLEAADEAMSRLAPHARQFAREAYGLLPVLTALRDTGADALFPGLTESLENLEDLAPRIGAIMDSVGRVVGNTTARGTESLAGPRWEEFFDFIAQEAPQTIRQLAAIVGDLTHGLAELWMAFDPVNDDFGSWLKGVAEGFDQWASGLAGSQGFVDFVDYIRTTGPQVAETLGSLVDALVQLTQAAAPLGGVSLQVLESMADALSAIADSNLGPVLLSAAAGMAALSRAATVWSRVSGTSFGQTQTGSLKAMAAALDTTTRNQQRATLSVAAFAQAERDRTAAIRGGVATLGKSAAAVAGLAVATTGAADSVGMTNTASLALMGTMAGPWGAAMGGAAGIVLDLAKANDGLEAAIRGVDDAIAAGDLDRLIGEQDRLNVELNKQVGYTQGLQSTYPGLGQLYSWFGDKTDEGRRKQEEAAAATERLSKYQRVAASDRAYLNHLDDETQALNDNVRALRAKQDATIEAFDAETAWRQALKDARKQADSNTEGLAGNRDAVLDNRNALSQLASAWNGQSKAVKQNEDRYKAARRAFIDAAEGMGVTRQRARELADQMLNMPKAVATRMILKDEATARLDMIRNALASIKDKTVTVRVTQSGTAAVTPGFGPQGSADGSFVPKTGQPYADRHLYLLADGEGITTNRRGETDRFRDVITGINRGYSRAAVKGMLADGGVAGEEETRAGAIRRVRIDGYVSAEVGALIEKFRSLERALRRSERALDRETEERDRAVDAVEATRGLMADLAAAATAGFSGDPFRMSEGGAPWAAGGRPAAANPIRNLLEDINYGTRRQDLLAQLQAAGLGGNTPQEQAALDAALRAENDSLTAMLAAGQVQQFEDLFIQRQQLVSSFGGDAADAVFGAQLDAQMAEVQQQTAELRSVRDEVRALRAEQSAREREREQREKANAERTGKAAAQGVERGGNKAARRRRRDG